MTDTVKVPREATEEMLRAARLYDWEDERERDDLREVWRIMIAAAPPPQPEPGWQEAMQTAAKVVDDHADVLLAARNSDASRGVGWWQQSLYKRAEEMRELAAAIRALPAPPKETKP